MKEAPTDKPMEIAPEQPGRTGEWIGFAIVLLSVGLVMTTLLLWLTGSFLIAGGTTVGMIGLMLLMGWMASGALDRRR
jgi:Flp pilus assembly protein TadB